jgi:hypothetical protein
VNAEAEESLLLEAVTRERLVELQFDTKYVIYTAGYKTFSFQQITLGFLATNVIILINLSIHSKKF